MESHSPQPVTASTDPWVPKPDLWDYFIAGANAKQAIYAFPTELAMRQWFADTALPRPAFANTMWRINRDRTKPGDPLAFRVQELPGNPPPRPLAERYGLVAAAMLLLALVGTACAADWIPATVDTYALGLAQHFNHAGGFSDVNPGLGLGFSAPLSDDRRLELAFLGVRYRDSYRATAAGVGGGLRYTLGDPDAWNLTGAAMVALLHGSGHDGPVALPVLGAGYGHVHLEATYSPVDTLAACWLRVSFQVNP